MKICQLCAVDFTLHHILTPLLRGLVQAGHEVVAVAGDGPLLAPVRAAGIRVVPLAIPRRASPLAQIRAIAALVRLFRQERFDLVHVHTPAAGLVGRVAAWLAGVPRIVYTAHGFYFHERMAAPSWAAHLALEFLCGRLTDTLFTVSAEDAATACRFHLCRTGDILAVGNGRDGDIFRPGSAAERARVRSSFDTPQERIVALTVGRLVVEKGYRELLAALRPLDIELWAVAPLLASDRDRRLADLPEQVAADPALAGRVRFLGHRDDVAELLRGADLFVLASHREGLPLSIIEAMLAGLPVVATDIRGCREAVEDGVTGLIVPPGDAGALSQALARLAGDAGLRARLGAAGRTRALDRYDERQVVARQLEHLGLLAPVAAAA